VHGHPGVWAHCIEVGSHTNTLQHRTKPYVNLGLIELGLAGRWTNCWLGFGLIKLSVAGLGGRATAYPSLLTVLLTECALTHEAGMTEAGVHLLPSGTCISGTSIPSSPPCRSCLPLFPFLSPALAVLCACRCCCDPPCAWECNSRHCTLTCARIRVGNHSHRQAHSTTLQGDQCATHKPSLCMQPCHILSTIARQSNTRQLIWITSSTFSK
jgi:hypothetical protein